MKIAKSSFCYVRVLKTIWLIRSKKVNCRFMIFTKSSLWFYQIWKIEKTAKILKLFIFSTFGSSVNVKISHNDKIFISFTKIPTVSNFSGLSRNQAPYPEIEEKARKSFPANRQNFYHIKEETFLDKRGIFITEEIFIHIYLHSQEKTLFYCDCVVSRQETKDIRSIFFCVLPFDHLLNKTMVTDK